MKKTLLPGPSVLDRDAACRFPHLLLLEASAGAGKTHALASRYVQFLLSPCIPHHDLTNLLAITFTNKAAREMKERILRRLKALALGLDPEEAVETLALVNVAPEELPSLAGKKVAEIINRFSDFRVQTIDSFLTTVLKASALELGLGPDPEIELSYPPLLDYALSALLREVGPDEDTPIRRAVDEYLQALNRAPSGSFVWDPVKKFQAELENLLGQEARHQAPLAFEDRTEQIARTLEKIRKLYEQVAALGLEPSKGSKMPDYLREGDAESLLSHSLALPFNKGRRKELHRKAWQEWEALIPLIGELAEGVSRTKVASFGRIFAPFKASLALAKARLGRLHISDISLLLSKYLSRDQVPEVFYRLGDRIEHFLIDEFQDTDPGQWRNLRPLLEEAFSKQGSLFAVGDLKQAIYLFRRADYRIMRDLIQNIQGEPSEGRGWFPPSIRGASEVRPLRQNYRSDGVILDYVKQVFQEDLARWAEAQGYEDRTGLTSFAQDPLPGRKQEGYVRVMVLRPLEKELGDAEPPEKQVLNEILSDLQARGYARRDIAILAGRNESIERAVGWLTEWGIQATSTSSLDIRKRRVIAELLLLLKFLDAPIDDLAFAGFLAGEVFLEAAREAQPGLDRRKVLDFLARARIQGPKGRSLYRSFREDPELAELWDPFFQDLYRKVGYYPLYDLASLALKTFRVAENFPGEAGAVLKFLEVIGSGEDKGMNSLKRFLEEASDQEAEAFSLGLPEYLDAVQLLTFYKAKGLGFPVTINLIYGHPIPADNLLFRPERGRVTVQYQNADLIRNLPELGRLREEARNEALTQVLNTLYVVCTRAEHELYNLVIPVGRQPPKWLELFQNLEAGVKRAKVSGKGKTASEPLKITLSALEVETRDQAPKGWTVLRQEEAVRGDIVHWVLARIETIEEPLEPQLSGLLAQSLSLFGRDYGFPELQAVLKDSFALPGFRAVFEQRPGRRILREVEYVDERGELLRMDRVVFDQEAVTVIDFKSGEAVTEEHRKQVRGYMHVLKHIHPSLPVQGLLAYLDGRKVVEVLLDQAKDDA